MANELHARPFPALNAPSRAMMLAFSAETETGRFDVAAQRAHLENLLELFGAARPAPDAASHTAELGRVRLKWELHSEFATFAFFEDDAPGEDFSNGFDSFAPEDWLAEAPGAVIAAIKLRIERADSIESAEARLGDGLARHFVSESMSAAHVTEMDAMVVGDFRIHEDGFTRFVIVAQERIGARRLGRVAQRLFEIETYRAMAMLALPTARRTSMRLAALDVKLSALVDEIAAGVEDDGEVFTQLTKLSADAQAMSAETAFRFGAGRAYSDIVQDRIEVLREVRIRGRQLISEFMRRRFEPAMRTCRSVEWRLAELSKRASRAANLLSTQVQVNAEAQNQRLLESMNRRAALQLRLQETVEGLSVVAISYYALNLVVYALGPTAELGGFSKTVLTSVATIPVVLLVWMFVRRLRKSVTDD